MAPKISIVIPVYNSQDFLSSCLDSVFSQTFKDVELICVNDGSTDDSYNILEKYAKKHSNMTVINQDNYGIGKATNRGIQEARGEYLYSLDNDDTLIDDNVLLFLFKTAEEFDLDVLTFNYTTETQVTRVKQPSYKVMTGVEYLQGEYIPPLWSKLCRLEYIRTINFKFREDLSFVDTEAVPRLLLNAQRIMHVDKVLYRWRRLGNNTSSVSQNLSNLKSASAYSATTLTYDEILHQASNSHLKAAMRRERYKAMVEVARIAAVVNTVESKKVYDDLLALGFSAFERFLLRNEVKFFYNTYFLKKHKITHPWVYLFRKLNKLFT
ncbi:MAG: glycosyltransferase [Pseudomonadota bacterium]